MTGVKLTIKTCSTEEAIKEIASLVDLKADWYVQQAKMYRKDSRDAKLHNTIGQIIQKLANEIREIEVSYE